MVKLLNALHTALRKYGIMFFHLNGLIKMKNARKAFQPHNLIVIVLYCIKYNVTYSNVHVNRGSGRDGVFFCWFFSRRYPVTSTVLFFAQNLCGLKPIYHHHHLLFKRAKFIDTIIVLKYITPLQKYRTQVAWGVKKRPAVQPRL